MYLYRCREKQRKEASRLQAVNRKLTAMNKLLMEENDRLQKQVSQLVYENSYFRQHTQNVGTYKSSFFLPLAIRFGFYFSFFNRSDLISFSLSVSWKSLKNYKRCAYKLKEKRVNAILIFHVLLYLADREMGFTT